MIRITLHEDVSGIAPAEALSWWWDFEPGDHDHRFLRLRPQRQVREISGSEQLIEDRYEAAGIQLFEERLTARLDGYAVAFEGQNTLARFNGAYTFQEAVNGTRVRLEAEVHLKPMLAWTEAIARPIVQKILERDLQGHVDEMRLDLG